MSVTIHPPLTMGAMSQEHADAKAAAGLFADDAAGLIAAYRLAKEQWLETEAWVRGLDPALLDERVNGEWSYLETLRHLVFGTDGWISGMLRGDFVQFHPLGVAPDHAPDSMRTNLDPDARPTLAEVMVARDDRRALAEAAFLETTEDNLLDKCGGMDGMFVRAAALQVNLNEEVEHHRFAVRDLSVLTGRTVPASQPAEAR